MFRVSSRARAVIATTAVVVCLAACGASPDSTTGPPPDLLQALPEPATAPTTVLSTPSAAPTATAKARPKPATATPPRRTTTGPGKAGQTPAQIAANWRPVGGDEFNAGALDESKWGTYDSVGAFGNGTRSPSAIGKGGGNLIITGKNEGGGVSGGMADSFGQTYGRWEFRARTDLGRGFGSAILLWPDSEKLSDGELDIMEVPNERRDRANFVVHSGDQGQTTVGTALPGRFDQWHTFAIEWLPTSVTWYVDGRQQYKLTDKAVIPKTSMHLTIQLDQGPKTDWIAAPDGTTPAAGIHLDVDYVHVYAPATPPV